MSNISCLNYWGSRFITANAVHNLTVPCPPLSNSSESVGIHSLDSPSTFFVQVLRLSVAACFIIIILSLYNSIEVLGRIVFSVASCSLHWVVYLTLIIFNVVCFASFLWLWLSQLMNVVHKQMYPQASGAIEDQQDEIILSLVLVIMLPIIHSEMDNDTNTDHLNQTGFIIITILQLLTILILFCSLEHELRFRSPDYASVDSPFSRCAALTKWRLFISWPRIIAIIVASISLLLLIAMEAATTTNPSNDCNHTDITEEFKYAPLVWLWFSSLMIMRLGVVTIGIGLLCVRHETLKLTIVAKIYLVLGIVFSLGEDIPNSIITVYPDEKNACFTFITSYDLLQALGILSVIAFLLFVRSQYLRVEQETKLSVVWDMQRLLQVNGRRDVRAH